MRRREFITGIGLTVAWPRLARSQRAKPLVGILTFSQPLPSFMTAFHQGLSQLGFVEGANVDIDYRSAEGQPSRLPALAEDLVQRRVAVIVTPDSSSPALAAKAATNTIPIVFGTGFEPVARGLVVSLARPGGNVTGLYVLTVGLIAKRVELLHRVIPTATSIALLQAYKGSQEEEGETAARAWG